MLMEILQWNQLEGRQRTTKGGWLVHATVRQATARQRQQDAADWLATWRAADGDEAG